MASRLKRALQQGQSDIVTPMVRQLMLDEPESAAFVRPEYAELILPHLMVSKGAAQDRSGAFHPSGLTDCERAQVFGFHGMPTKGKRVTPRLLSIFIDGNYRHVKWQTLLLNAGAINDIEVGYYDPQRNLTGHVDGVSVNIIPGLNFGVEIKGTSQMETVRRYGPLPHHKKQVHAYMLLSGLDTFLFIYEDKATNDWIELRVDRNDHMVKQLEGIVADLNEYIDKKKLPPVLSDCHAGVGPYKECPYAYACKQIRSHQQVVEASAQGDAEGVIQALGLKRRNTHTPQGPGLSARRFDAGPAQPAGRVLRLRRRVDGKGASSR